MKFQVATAAALFAGMLPSVSAHYFFDGLVVNGQKSTEFVRENTRQTKYMPTKFIKTFDNLTPLDTDFRCNLGATANAARGTAQIKAGDSLAMTLGVGATMRHPGPAQVYMSKAPSTAAAYDGSGGWFKIHQETICNPSGNIKEDAWCTWDKDRVSFKVPAEIEDGEYLIRAEHIGLHGAHGGEAEFYYGCAQVSVSGGAGSAPASTVKIPGMYQKADPEVNFSVWGTNKDYPAKGPGPAIATFGAASAAPNTSNNAVVSAPDTGADADEGSCGSFTRRHARHIKN